MTEVLFAAPTGASVAERRSTRPRLEPEPEPGLDLLGASSALCFLLKSLVETELFMAIACGRSDDVCSVEMLEEMGELVVILL